uniref:NADH dehydrogenase subunit 6 n=1 Tax=Dictyotopsis propagulifera TaxID=670095 RepID=UPI002E75BFBE|nr:NADH dehydrogenase subunit 6 [Dictyotopsis propagulifera]WBP69968.1 NADH dehydrogenase subunit 6 [Dictyotopsis propagulifera]
MLELYFFILTLSLFLGLGLNVVISQNPIYSVLYLVLFFITGSSFLALFGFDYLSLIFILVYAGAIAVLFLFVVMILDIKIINKPGFNGMFLVVFSLFIFLFPLFYNVTLLIIILQKIGFDFYFNTFVIQFNNIWNNLEFHDKFLDISSTHFIKSLNQYLYNSEFFIQYKINFYNLFLIIKFIFCQYGFKAPMSNNLLNQYNEILNIDYESSVKNFQILYSDFTSIFVISGGVLLIAMIGCISLALPSFQNKKNKNINREFIKN